MAAKLEGEGVKALMAWPLVEELFCGFPRQKEEKKYENKTHKLPISLYIFTI